jgi:hypothetical protein
MIADSEKKSPARDLSLREWIDFLTPGLGEEGLPPAWPPDAFAVTASLLHRSGAYCRVIEAWPPSTGEKGKGKKWGREKWVEAMRDLGRVWREQISRAAREDKLPALSDLNPSVVPDKVWAWWALLLRHGERPLSYLDGDDSTSRELRDAILQICIVADEACEGVGVPGTVGTFARQATSQLISTSDFPGGATLCHRISTSRYRVLPKLHAPQSGLSIRALSHHLALCASTEVAPGWFPVVSDLEISRSMNLLVVPWPKVVVPHHFRLVEEPPENLQEGLFAYSPGSGADIVRLIPRLLDASEAQVGRIDGVVLPELALDEEQHRKVRELVLSRKAFLVTGVRSENRKRSRSISRNYWSFSIPFLGGTDVPIIQDKHHRWRLDRRQIVQYGLGGRLHPSYSWWENISIGRRRIWFIGLRRWLTICVLICEDLARQEPVSDVLRAVGPNLIFALLMDGPQLASRWPGRYATVLADDPGSSVLTVTSLGMAQLSRAEDGRQGSRIVALWKDDKYGANVPIELPEGADGVVLSIVEELKEEWSADGRRKKPEFSAYPTLNGISPVRVVTA